jgi:hypothetical protein
MDRRMRGPLPGQLDDLSVFRLWVPPTATWRGAGDVIRARVGYIAFLASVYRNCRRPADPPGRYFT